MKDWKPTGEALTLLMEGQMAYARIEATGVRVDRAYLETTIKETEERLAVMETELRSGKVARLWKKAYGDKTNFESNAQLAHVVFDRLGYESKDVTATGQRQVSKKVLEQIDHPFVVEYLKVKPLRVALRTFLVGIRRELVRHADGDWYVHPHHNLNTTQTYRPSSDKPNWRNFPKRNPEIAELVRKAYVPRRGRRFGENDYGQIEIRVPAALTGDEELRRYVLDKSTDMHRDQACAVFFLPKDGVPKNVRSQVKNNFVFCTFYGGSPAKSAKGLWEDVGVYNLCTAGGVPLKDHLKEKGVTRLGSVEEGAPVVEGTFVHHVRECQRKLWNRFKGYAAWRKRTTDRYHRDGGLVTATGFVVTGDHSPTEIPNYPIQGPAYHCTLSAVVMLLPAIKKYRMKTLVLGDIYDSIQADVPKGETRAWLDLCHDVMTRRVPEKYPWLKDIPLEIECELSEVNGSWFGCKEWVRKEGVWSPK